ncbi:hypothetical protein LIA77_00190 [Sarocladium implicatum]|nr:hypothetical protein LIA77_00190 [Sarocladium implicatum]
MSLSILQAPRAVVMSETFTIELSTDRRPTSRSTFTIHRDTVAEDPDENQYDIPLRGPTKVTVDNNGKAKFELRFEDRRSLVEARMWPIPFHLKNSHGRTLASTKAHVACLQSESDSGIKFEVCVERVS